MINYKYIKEGGELWKVISWLGEQTIIGIDTETTGLAYQRDRIRLIQLSNGEETFLIDCFPLRDKVKYLLPILEKTTLVGHNLQFDLGMLYSNFGFLANSVYCTQLMSQVIAAGMPARFSLAAVAKRYLDIDVDKGEQTSNWSAPVLSKSQLDYAAEDTSILLKLKERLDKRIEADGLQATAKLENDTVLFIAWMAATGVPWDRDLWQKQIDTVEEERIELEKQLDLFAPDNPQLDLWGNQGWAWSSKVRTDKKKGTEPIEKQVLRQLGFQFRIAKNGIETICDDDLAVWNHPLAKPLRKWHTCKHNLATYGYSWFEKEINGRIFPKYWQIKDTGRTGSNEPNGQNIPKKEIYRAAFAAKEGWKFVHADYSGNEARCAAHIAPEPVLLKAWHDDPQMDMHMLTAVRTFRKPADQIEKVERSKAKSLNFRCIYGGGYNGLVLYMKAKADIDITLEEAKILLNDWRKAYPGLAQWHRNCGKDRATELRTLGGRLRRLPYADMMTTKTNTVVQGTCADGVKTACANIYKKRERLKGAEPILIVHDELDFHSPEEVAEEVRAFVHEEMVKAMQPLMPSVPVVVDSAVQSSWAG